MKRRTRILAWLGGGALILVIWQICLAVWPAPILQLENGSFVTVAGVTHGRKHRVKVGTRAERLAGLLPNGLFPKLKRPWILTTNTPTDTLVVWLWATNAPAHYEQYGAGFVAGANDVEVETARMLVKERSVRQGWVFALALDAVPRREKQFVLRLRNVYSMVGNTRFPSPLGEVTFSNPLRSRAAPWRAPTAPQRVATREFECELKGCDLHTNSLMGTPLWLDWRFTENGQPVDHWKVQRIELEDATGNVLKQDWWDGPATDRDGSSAGWVRRCLFPGSGAWKIRAHILRIADFPSNEVVELGNMPVPLQPGYAANLYRRQVEGGALDIGSYMALGSSRLGVPQTGFPVLDGLYEDWVTVLFESTDLKERTRLISLKDDRGRTGLSPQGLRLAPAQDLIREAATPVFNWTRSPNTPRWGATTASPNSFSTISPTDPPTPTPWAANANQVWDAPRLSAWRRDWETNAVSCTIRLGVSRWRVVEFLVEPTVVAPPPTSGERDSGIALEKSR